MIYLLVVALAIGLVYSLRLLSKQNRALRDLHATIQSGQAWLHEENPNNFLPAWSALSGAVNTLVEENERLRQQHTDQLTQLEATLGNLREAVLIVDANNYVHLANRAVREVFPSASDHVNLRLELIVRSAPFLQYVNAIRAGESLPRQEFEVFDRQTTRWIEVSGAPIPAPDGKSSWALFVIHDMTSQRKLERVRRDFVANASHELRTPLSVIKGYVETLVDGHETMALEDRTRFLNTIHRHSERLKAIIDDLLVLSRLESATPGLKFKPVELAELFQTLAEDYRRRPNATEHQIIVAAPADLGSVHGDEEKLTQVFSNLFDNALKYTPKGARLELGGNVTDTGEVECFFRDNGPGIPAADLPHIFERFYRVDKGRSRETGGTGLGLSIVKHIVQMHGGQVWAESVEGQGLTIRVRLPRKSPV